MNPPDDQLISSNPSSQGLSPSPQPHFSFVDLDDIDDDEDLDDECLDSTDEIQNILQTFGNLESPTLTMDYFDSRRYEIMYEIMNIERQFEQLKNILYDDSLLLIDDKLLSIQNEEAPEYQDELKKLHEEMKLRLEIAKQRRHIELQALENATQAELLSLEQTLENDKVLLYHQVREDIERKIEELETLKMKTELSTHILQEMFPQEPYQTVATNKRRADTSDSFKHNQKKRRANISNGNSKTIDKDSLAIFYQLSDIDAIEDWALIQTSLQHSSTHRDESDRDSDDERYDDEPSHCSGATPNVSYVKHDEIHDDDENRV